MEKSAETTRTLLCADTCSVCQCARLVILHPSRPSHGCANLLGDDGSEGGPARHLAPVASRGAARTAHCARGGCGEGRHGLSLKSFRRTDDGRGRWWAQSLFIVHHHSPPTLQTSLSFRGVHYTPARAQVDPDRRKRHSEMEPYRFRSATSFDTESRWVCGVILAASRPRPARHRVESSGRDDDDSVRQRPASQRRPLPFSEFDRSVL